MGSETKDSTLENVWEELRLLKKELENLKNKNSDGAKLKFLITGGLGHVGSAIIQEYIKRDDVGLIRILDNLSTKRYCSLFNLPKTHVKIEFIEGEINNKELVKKAVEDIDIVIHLAAIANVHEAIANPKKTDEINFEGVKLVLESSIGAGVKKFIFPSTTSVYGNADGERFVDENYQNYKPEGPYAINKRKAEELVLESNGRNGIQTFVLRKGTIYGKSIGMRFYTAVNKFVWLAMSNRPLTVWDNAINQKRPYLSLKDAVRAYEFVEKKGVPGELYNVLNKNYTVSEIVEHIKKLKPNAKITIVKAPLDTDNSFEVSNEKMKQLGFEYKDNLLDALTEEMKLFESIDNSSFGQS